MAKQERRIFDKDVQVWVHRYENLRNMAHWHFENELVVCQEGAAEIMLDGIFYTLHQGDCAFFCGERVHNIRGTVDSRNCTVFIRRPKPSPPAAAISLLPISHPRNWSQMRRST